jgi:hypothetical protein
LHKYLYTSADPVNRIDPSGNFSLVSIAITSSIIGILSGILAYAFTGSLRTAVIVGVSVFVLSFMTLGLISALTAGAAGTVVTGAGTATIPAAPRLLNPTTWQQAERLLSQVLTVAKNTQSFFVRGMSQARIPDFVVQGRYIADSKFVQTLTQTAQLRDFAVLAQNMNVPMYVFVRANTYVTGPVLQLIRSTGGDVIRIFH